MNKRPRTTVLVGINVAVYLAMCLSGISPFDPSAPDLLRWGGNFGPLSLGPQPWRLLVSNYVHVGILHIGLNMWCLWSLGILAERIFDPWTYIFIYTATGLAGSLASAWWHPHVVGVGASGAIFGVAGALIAALYFGNLPVPRAALRGTMKSLLAFAGYNLLFGAAIPGIDNWAHVGGLVVGLALGAAMAGSLMAPPRERDTRRRAVFAAVAIVFCLGYAALRRG
ncbi:MAG TPA: rhomboid family intramembrane serine protease [Elusimicrobiota bacterium]|nr:rhomboid family intramembrane serine protease [Elusimicrobiota bacterium]